MLLAQIHRGLQIAQFAATLVARADLAVQEHLFLAQQADYSVNQLNLAADDGVQALQLGKNARRQDVSARLRQRSGLIRRCGLIHQGTHVHQTICHRLAAHDTSAVGALSLHILQRQNAGAPLGKIFHHLLHHGRLAHQSAKSTENGS